VVPNNKGRYNTVLQAISQRRRLEPDARIAGDVVDDQRLPTADDIPPDR